MKRNDPIRISFKRPGILISALAMLALTACNSGTSMKTREEEKMPAAAQNMSNPEIDLNCVVSRLQNPPEAFHYSFKKKGDVSFVYNEADVTPQTIDGYFETNMNDVTKPPITSKVHAVRSNEDDWRMATGSLSGIMGLAGLGGLIIQSAICEGADEVNGYSTTRYTVDTARADANSTAIMLGAGGFIKGTVWITSDGCPVKMLLDEERHHNDGSADKTHFEEAIVKK
jgi:hypothetical protein